MELRPASAAPEGDLSELFVFVEREEEAKAAERRRRHRESMARGRSRRGASMAAMRAEHAALLRRQQALLAARRQPPGDGADTDSDGSDAREGFLRAVEAENALHREREQLARRLEQLEIFEAMLRVDTAPLGSESGGAGPQAVRAPEPEHERVPGRRGRLVYFAPEEPPFYFEPVSEQTCHDWARETYQASRRHHARFGPDGAGGGGAAAHCFGWRVRRSRADSHLHFHFSKRFHTADPEALAARLLDRGWDVLNDPAKYARLYRTVLIVKVLQRVDPFNSLILRNSPSPDRSLHMRSVTFMSKVDDVDERGRRVLSIVNLVTDPRQELAPPPPEDGPPRAKVRYIRDASTYIMLTIGYGVEGEREEDGDGDGEQSGQTDDEEQPAGPYVEMTYGGHGDCLNETQAQYLFVETGHVLFRFEQVLCPRNLVTSS